MTLKEVETFTYSHFINELHKEVDAMKINGTLYRRKTSELSLMVAKRAKSVVPFVNRDVAYQTVANLLPVENEDRLKDVAKMLNVVFLDLHSTATLSDELKASLAERRHKRKPIKLVPVK